VQTVELMQEAHPVVHAVKTNDAQSELLATPSPGEKAPLYELIHPAACRAIPIEVHPCVVAQ